LTVEPASTALLTDHYELTMLAAALRSGLADRRSTFELFARRLPRGRRYGVAVGVGRLVAAITAFRFDAAQIEFLRRTGVVDEPTAAWLGRYRFGGSVDAYAEGEVFFPYSPVVTIDGTFGESVVLETVALSILNHDSAVGAAAARMRSAAGTRSLVEMGTRRTGELTAPAAARAAWICGFDGTSNLEAGRRYGVPTMGTAAHAFSLGHLAFHPDDPGAAERAAFAAQLAALGPSTTLLVDTFDIASGVANAVEAARAAGLHGPGAIRIDSGDLPPGRARPASSSPATSTSTPWPSWRRRRSTAMAPGPVWCRAPGIPPPAWSSSSSPSTTAAGTWCRWPRARWPRPTLGGASWRGARWTRAAPPSPRSSPSATGDRRAGPVPSKPG